MSPTAERAAVTVAELVVAITEQRRDPAIVPGPRRQEPAARDAVSASIAVVLGAHPGAGASAVALAFAEAATRQIDDGHTLIRLMDASPQHSSGLVCAAERELGAHPTGWRIGRRGDIEIHRPKETMTSPVELPELAAITSDRLVIDAGWTLHELRTTPNAIVAALSTGKVVLVCRATVPGIRRAERVLADLPGDPVVVGVGARRWPGPVHATFGPHLKRADDAGRIVLMPANRRLEINGLDARPLPRAFVVAAARLLDLVWPDSRTPPAFERMDES